MCGRYYIEIDKEELEEICKQVQQNIAGDEQLSFNMESGEVFPTNIVPVRVGDSEYKAMKWGFTGFDGKPIINARSETATEKPTFKKPMQTGRCLIPASGYYEWQKVGTKKQKYSFLLPENKTMYMAGCYRVEEGSSLYRFVILTRAASTILKEIHERMPVIIPVWKIHDWLDNGSDTMNHSIGDLAFQKA